MYTYIVTSFSITLTHTPKHKLPDCSTASLEQWKSVAMVTYQE